MAISQAPNSIVMVRPWRFFPNPQTAHDNGFQKKSINNISLKAKDEFDAAVNILKKHNINIHVFDDFGGKKTPDSVFPNNWFSTDNNGHIVLYPMFSLNRRRERRNDIIEMLKLKYIVQNVVDFSKLEQENLFLEGTGSMVLDNINRIAYMTKSNRSNEIVLNRFCSMFKYEPMVFNTADKNGSSVYHTNVIMCIASSYALICFDMITDKKEEVKKKLKDSDLKIIELSFEQINNFAGNAIELTVDKKSYLVMSKCAKNILTKEQTKEIESNSEILALDIPTIELAGGSARCMMAGIHLTSR